MEAKIICNTLDRFEIETVDRTEKRWIQWIRGRGCVTCIASEGSVELSPEHANAMAEWLVKAATA